VLLGGERVEVRREGPMPCRRVSWIPGAEGAPREEPERCEWVVEWPAAGAMRIACLEEVRWFVEGE